MNAPDALLEGKGKKRRHLKLYMVEDIKNKKAEYFLKQCFEKKFKNSLLRFAYYFKPNFKFLNI